MEITYTLNNEVIFDLTGKDILKHVGKDIGTLLVLLVLTSIVKEKVIIDSVKAFKTVDSVECFNEAFKYINSAMRI